MRGLGARTTLLTSSAVVLLLAAMAIGMTACQDSTSATPEAEQPSESMGVEMPDGSVYGNVPGNVANGGWVNAYDDWIYYDSLPELQDFYRMRVDGSEKNLLDDGGATYVSMYEGWIYYISLENHICRMRPNGEGQEQVTTFTAFSLNIVDGWMYFTRNEPGTSFLTGDIWKMRPGGSEMKLLRKDSAEDMVAYGGWLYFNTTRSSEDRSQRPLYRIDFEGNNLQQVSESVHFYAPAGDWIFYRSFSEEGLHKVRLDGSDAQKVNDANPLGLNVLGDWVYYADRVDAFIRPLYRVNIETSEQLLVSDKNCTGVAVVGDRILIREVPGEFGIIPYDGKRYLADPDGSNVLLVDERVD